jgi:hypothetical protein
MCTCIIVELLQQQIYSIINRRTALQIYIIVVQINAYAARASSNVKPMPCAACACHQSHEWTGSEEGMTCAGEAAWVAKAEREVAVRYK